MKHQRISQEGLYSCRCSTTSPGDQETMKKNASQMPISFLYLREDLEKDKGHSSPLVLRKSGTLSVKIVQKEYGTKLQKGCCWNLLKVDVQFFRATTPFVQRSTQNQRTWKTVDTQCIRFGKDWDFFAKTISVNRLSLYGAVAETCEEYETFTIDRGNPLWEGNQVLYSRKA